ncbi:MAG: hypothetical protein M1274_11120 [Actinobacteria bacterium]|nr:hypothetical protein [Actinomycetota bacterium]
MEVIMIRRFIAILLLTVLVLFATAGAALAADEAASANTGLLALLSSNVLIGSLLAIVGLVLLDLVVTVAVAIARKTFDWNKLLDFLRTQIVPYIICWGAIEALFYLADHAAFPPDVLTPFVGLGAIIYALIVARLISSILGTFKDLGLPTA